jgi:7-carboxy-7-deazaguanine synthase
VKRHLKINEIFFSIQGESSHVGKPCAFVRLMGCPLRCGYCDTAYAFTEGKSTSFEEIFAVLATFPTRLVEVTGGEPLAQSGSVLLMQELVQRGYDVLLETSGALPIAEVPREVHVIMDVKTPGSSEVSKMHWDNMAYLKPGLDEVKFVICSKEDFDFAVAVCKQYALDDRFTVLLSPSFGVVPYKTLAEWILASGKNFRMQIQLHKEIWGAEVRGV